MARWTVPALALAVVTTAVVLTLISGGSTSSTTTTVPTVSSSTTTTTRPSPSPSSTTTTPVTVTPATTTTTTEPFKTRSGLFVPGWETCIEQIRCDDNVPFVDMEIAAPPFNIAAGDYDLFIVEWLKQYFAVCGPECILAPMAEMNGKWVPWYTDVPQEYIDAYVHIRELAEPLGSTTWAYAPAQVLGWKDYAPPDFDLLTPSIFATDQLTALDVIGRAVTMRAFFDKPTIIAQTGTLRLGEARDEWLRELHRLATREEILGVILFDVTNDSWAYGYPGGLLNSEVYQEILDGTQND
jgi:hypothetical protein